MVPVKVVDVGRREVNKDSGEPFPLYSLFLFDEAGRRVLCIMVGEAEGTTIYLQLMDKQVPRPMTPLFIARLLDAAGATIDSVEITELKETVFYAIVKMRVGTKLVSIDARPSDAIALALQVDAPINVSEELLQRAGTKVPDSFVPTGSGFESIKVYQQQHEEVLARRRKRFEAKSEEQRRLDEAEWTQMIVSEAFSKSG